MKTTTKKGHSKSKAAKVPNKEKILRAAKKIFCHYPYSTASMRTIAGEAQIDHPLIIYYFSTKAVLFETVLKDLIEQYKQAMPGWFLGIREMGLIDGVSTYLDRALGFHFEHPEMFRIILLNMTQSVKKGGMVPGYQLIQDIFHMWANGFSRRPRFNIESEQTLSFLRCMGLLMINLIGAREYHAEIQGMDPKSDEYLSWVKKQIMFIIVPVLNSFELKE
ncbi:MAG: TetR/AcrR family transcriptional regulator [Desulfobacteraceae bacterium]|nr:MAG: TetR/AcrR family transcriptional regulator [Desulfobacteraceae bacterium]